MNLENQLKTLLDYQDLLLQQRKLELKAQALKEHAHNDLKRDELLAKSTQLSEAVARSESLNRDRRRLLDEQQLVAKRFDQDQARLRATAVPRDAIALQHEIETLQRRAQVLTEELQHLDGEIAAQNEIHHKLEREREGLERELELERESIKIQLDELRVTHSANRELLQQMKSGLDQHLLAEFERLFARGAAIGRLRNSMCGACNMTLTSTALNALLAQPRESLMHCPECGAILVKE